MTLLNESLGKSALGRDVESFNESLGGTMEIDIEDLVPELITSINDLGEMDRSLRGDLDDLRGMSSRWGNIQTMLKSTLHNLRLVTKPDYANAVVS